MPVAAMKAGAYDYITKPFSLEEIQLIVERANPVAGLKAENQALRDTMDNFPLLECIAPRCFGCWRRRNKPPASDATIL